MRKEQINNFTLAIADTPPTNRLFHGLTGGGNSESFVTLNLYTQNQIKKICLSPLFTLSQAAYVPLM